MSTKSLFIITHKKIDNPIPRNHKILFVGAYNKEVPNGYLSDDFSGGISNLNPYFCELTGLYYIWKNCNSDIISLEHYRRLFIKTKKYFFHFPFLGLNDIDKLMINYDIVVPKRYLVNKTGKEIYEHDHIITDLLLTRDIIKEYYSSYLEAFDEMLNSKENYYYNMFITKKEILNDYCSFMFDVLFKLQNEIDYQSRDQYQARVFGFISERLFTVYLFKHKELKIKEQYIEFLDKNIIKTQIRRIKDNLKK